MVRAALDVVAPSLDIKWERKKAHITVKGCPSAVVNGLKV
jgi:hypothetical protein